MDNIKKTQFYHCSTFSENELNTFTKILGSWPLEHIIPYLDIFRMFLLHPRSNELFKKLGGGIQEYTRFLQILNNGTDNQKILVLRILNNFFNAEGGRLLALSKRQEILDNASNYLDSSNKNIRSAIVGLIFK